MGQSKGAEGRGQGDVGLGRSDEDGAAATLKAERGDEGEDAFGEAAPDGAVGSEAALAPENGIPQQSFDQVVGWGGQVMVEEDPQAGLVFEDLGADALRLARGWCGGGEVEHAHDLLPVLRHLGLELLARDAAGRPICPASEDPAGGRPQPFSIPGTGTPALDHSLEVAQEVGPAGLVLRGGQPWYDA